MRGSTGLSLAYSVLKLGGGAGDIDDAYQWTYFVTIGPVIKIVNMRGEVVEATGYWSVRHYYDEQGKLLKRIPVRKDLGCGKRLVR
ncbi:MAG TPA: hypothetical protein DEG18_01640 [Candidatus Yanofskybacteria bacterium]|nr:MAG: hypothetical protein A2302_02770 [Candidatus Yanofskybacteria bacterium RIFOXYB2_FULL_44_18]OGN37091.1 MAG: hypothetical protein A2371_01195 [Candidatus Yanofskybacteria bacterium RIFOXYB1_FULL_44_29]HBX58294.1 hypothetical protein [Candidatus Yanofskybacteria bacterium]